MTSLQTMWRALWLRAPACSSDAERRALWLELWPLREGQTPASAMARVHPVHRAGVTELLCEMGAAWCHWLRFPRDEERDLELWLWEAAHAGDRRALTKWTEANWRADFSASPTHRLVDLLLQSGREDDAALRLIAARREEEAALARDENGSRARGHVERLIGRVAQEDEGWRLRAKMRELLRP